MLARKTCWLEPMACTPTLLPLRSAMRWTVSFANSSKHPTCAPAMTVSGSPASIGMRSGAAKVNRKSASPRVVSSAEATPPGAAT